MKTVAAKSKFGKFFQLLQKMENYHPSYEKELRANIVREYSGGRTSSLTEMYNRFPELYFNMIQLMKEKVGDTPQAKRHYDPDEIGRASCRERV